MNEINKDTWKTEGELKQDFIQLFAMGKEETFEDGMESRFSERLIFMLEYYGPIALSILKDVIFFHENTNVEVAAEALIWLSEADDFLCSRENRLKILHAAIFTDSSRIRDAAIIGIAAMDSPDSIEHVVLGILWESIPELKEDMMQVFVQLEKTRIKRWGTGMEKTVALYSEVWRKISNG